MKSERVGLNVPWSWLTISAAIISLASVGTLVVVVSINDVDVLSTVALALAVLAFAAQLITTLAQAQAGASQVEQIERVNSDTKQTLAEIRTTGESLLSNQRDIFFEVLRAALASKGNVTGESFALELDHDVEGDQPSSLVSATTDVERSVAPALASLFPSAASTKPSALYRRLNSFPRRDEGESVFRKYMNLTPYAADKFAVLSRNIKSAAYVGNAPEASLNLLANDAFPRATEELVDAGLIRRITPLPEFPFEEDVKLTYELTDEGMTLTAILTTPKSKPKWLADLIQEGKP